jgi:hypothetical protein
VGLWGSKSLKGEPEGEVYAISRNGEEICYILKSGRTSEVILEEKFLGSEEGMRYIGHLYVRIGEDGANGPNVVTYRGSKEEHLKARKGS